MSAGQSADVYPHNLTGRDKEINNASQGEGAAPEVLI